LLSLNQELQIEENLLAQRQICVIGGKKVFGNLEFE
jgi:hypothetical protein